MAIITNFQTLTGRAPVFQDAEVGRVANNIIVLRYNKACDPSITPATTDFSVSGTVQTVSSIDFVGNTVRLTMSAALQNTDVLAVSYTPGINKLQDTSGNLAVALSSESVTNNIP